jgi:metal-responsive CopG/Arc/MetJ family transcriptional regulator
MSRRRSLNPTKAISVTLKQSTLNEIDDRLSLAQSRSALIQKAVTRYLSGHGVQSIHEWSIDGIIAHLLTSRDLTDHQKEIVLLFSKSL